MIYYGSDLPEFAQLKDQYATDHKVSSYLDAIADMRCDEHLLHNPDTFFSFLDQMENPHGSLFEYCHYSKVPLSIESFLDQIFDIPYENDSFRSEFDIPDELIDSVPQYLLCDDDGVQEYSDYLKFRRDNPDYKGEDDYWTDKDPHNFLPYMPSLEDTDLPF